MAVEKIVKMRDAHKVLYEFPFELKELSKGYSDRILRVDLDKNEVTVQPVTRQMKDLWIGGKGFDLWLMLQEINKDSKWDSPENPICFSPGPLGGTTSFPGSGKTLVTAISPLTHSVIDCNVGGYFGSFLKFAGFDALVLVGKAAKETIVFIDAIKKKITIETAPEESIDAHLLAEELTEMYADDDLDKRNIAVVSAGRGAQFTRVGVLNFSFWDWRRNVARLKQAGRGGVGTVFRDKMLKALVIKNRDITPAWRVEENKVAKWVKPKKISHQGRDQIPVLDAIIEKWGCDPEFVVEMMQDIQERFHLISVTAIERLTEKTAAPKAYLYHIATFDKFFTLEEKSPANAGNHRAPGEVKFFTKGQPVVLRNKDAENPRDIGQYTAAGGYKALKKVLDDKNPEGITGEVVTSGLRGRSGGAPVGLKWEAASKTGKEKDEDVYIVCSAGESDPGALVGKTILETDPHSVIEGMLIGAYAVGAKEGFIIIRKEHTLAEERLNKAIEAAQQKGFLGQHTRIRIHRTGGAAVCGESSAIITAMSGRAGESQPRYIPIEEHGFHGKPTLVHNVETWANIPVIIEKGAQWFTSAGTKVFSLDGNVRNNGLVEVPMGTTLREIVEDIGGGANGGGKLKAVQIGGPSGGCIPASGLDTQIDFEAIREAGAAMGAGSLTVMDDKTCMVDKARNFVEFLAEESCGTCTPCREGLYALKNTLNRICGGKGKQEDIQFLEEVSQTVQDTSLCQFGMNAPNSLLSTLRYFKEEYEEHIKQGKCSAGVCKFNA